MKAVYFLVAISILIAFGSCNKKVVVHDDDYKMDSTIYFAEKNYFSQYREGNEGVFFISQKGTPVYFASTDEQDLNFKDVFLVGCLRWDSLMYIQDEYVFRSKVFAEEIGYSSFKVEKKIPVKDKDGDLTVTDDARGTYQWMEGVKILLGKSDAEIGTLEEELPKLFGLAPSEDFNKDHESGKRGIHYLAVHHLILIRILQGETVKEAIVSYTKNFTKDFLPNDPKDWNLDQFPGIY